MKMHIIYRNKTKKGRKRPHNHIRHYESGRKTSVNKHIPIPKRYKKITKHQFLYSDFDRDGVTNKDDCYPFDKNMHKERVIDERVIDIRELLEKTPEPSEEEIEKRRQAKEEEKEILAIINYIQRGK